MEARRRWSFLVVWVRCFLKVLCLMCACQVGKSWWGRWWGGGEGIPGEAAGCELWLGGGWVAVWVPGGCFVIFVAEEVVGGFADLEEVGGDWVGVVVGVEGASTGMFDGFFAAGASFAVVGEFGGVFCEGVM